MELAFAALHQLCAPLLDCLGGLPGPHRDALEVTFGLSEGSVPDRFFVGLAVSACCPRRPSSARLCAWSMTRNGWTRPPRRRWRSWRGGCWRSRW